MSRPTDQDLDISVAAMLRFGVSLSALVVLIGGVLWLRHPLVVHPDYTHFNPGDPALRTLTGTIQGTIDFAPKSIIQLGLIVLIATPVARVVFCVIGFARQRNLLYVAVSSVVLTILLYSLIRGGL